MVLKRIASNLKPTMTRDEVPLVFHEPHVETGFRHPHQPWSYYFCSMFQKHNECMNVWTHFIGFCLTVARINEFSKEFFLITDRNMWPLMAGSVTMLAMFLCSTFAHCLQNKSELVHYTSFMIDYAGIGLYGFGSTLLHYTYCIDKSLLNSWIRHFAIPVGAILGLLVCFCCSFSKVFYKKPYPPQRKLWQIGSVAAIYIWLSVPIIHRITLSLEHGEWDHSLQDHLLQMCWFALSGFFFGSDIPQRFFPGRFDFLGHSHQLFHVCIIVVTIKQLDGIYLDVMALKENFAQLEMPTFMESIGALLFVIIGNALIVYCFHIFVKEKLEKEQKSEKEGKSD